MGPSHAPLHQEQTVSFVVTLIIFKYDNGKRVIELQQTVTLDLDAADLSNTVTLQRVAFDGMHFDIIRIEPGGQESWLEGTATCSIETALDGRTREQLHESGWVAPGLKVVE